MAAIKTLNDNVRYSIFSSDNGCDELFISVATKEGQNFSDALGELTKNYDDAFDIIGLSDSTAVFCRIFVSDILNQKSALVSSSLYKRLIASGALSIIEQKPVSSGPVSLLSYHIRDPKNTVTKHLLNPAPKDWRNDVLVSGNNYSLLWSANYTGGNTFDSYAQTATIFDSLNSTIEQNGMNLLDNGIRTWVYVRDVDNHYKDMVTSRKEYFTAHGLTNETRYLASTGILGMTHLPEKIVSVDSLSIGGLKPEQIVRMEALSHMSPTIVYGVTFERGLRVRFGDRSHLHISGTASIDAKGDVLYLGDAEAQTRRTIENIRALLEAQHATLNDMAYIIAYVRNCHDREFVKKVLLEEIGEKTPLVFVEASVCRPSWLVELEGWAIIPDKNEFQPFM